MENHDYEEWVGEEVHRSGRTTIRFQGRLRPPTDKGGEEFYSPPVFKSCSCTNGKCIKQIKSGAGSALDGAAYEIITSCSICDGTGRIPLFYTPEQWKEAGGILSGDTPCWQLIQQGRETLFFLEPYGNIKILREGTIIIATEAGRPPEEEENE